MALARLLVRTPRVFLMDEPLSNLDAKLRVHMRAELKHLQHELGITTIYVTHDQIEAMTLADRIAVMDEGVVQQLAKPKDIYNDPTNLFVAGFIGSPTMNFIPGELKDGSFVGHDVSVEGVGGGTRGGAILGVRPEDMTLVNGEGAHFSAPIYSVELTGEQTLITVQLGEGLRGHPRRQGLRRRDRRSDQRSHRPRQDLPVRFGHRAAHPHLGVTEASHAGPTRRPVSSFAAGQLPWAGLFGAVTEAHLTVLP